MIHEKFFAKILEILSPMPDVTQQFQIYPGSL